MDRQIFFDTIRKSVFGGRLTTAQVAGMETMLDTWGDLYPSARAEWIANSLAQVKRETGSLMVPIKETVMASHRDRNPSDRTVIQRLDRAFAKGQLPWVEEIYWREGWFGRGLIQITHERNYSILGNRLGRDLVGDPSLALEPRISAEIAIVGMVEGHFTGRSLADVAWDEPDPVKRKRGVMRARRIVNGPDGSDAEVYADHMAFLAALEAAGYAPRVEVPPRRPAPEPEYVAERELPIGGVVATETSRPAMLSESDYLISHAEAARLTATAKPSAPASGGWLAALLGAIARIFSRRA
ncbi:glycoside hydrolase family 19 protein [Salinarimonas rosea]|uniref:glycoside hydrolase family 19 protein n=1 Tax=Salinarimonas rosea TaxID=552063 RepID=UPI0004097F26|nr:glycoside hydrolase family 19 protein [Salinarimonas rosea]